MDENGGIGAFVGGAFGAVLAAALHVRRIERSGSDRRASAGHIALGLAAGAIAGPMIYSLARWPKRIARLERLMPKPATVSTAPQVVKPVPDTLFAARGTGTDYETRMSTMDGFLTPNDRFYLRSHSPTPRIDAATWRLRIHGTGVRKPIELSYEQISKLPQITLMRTLECAGNGRHFFKSAFGVSGDGGQWLIGAIGTAEWTGVRLRDVLALAEITEDARDVMPVGLDEQEVGRPMPLEKAMRDDTLLVLKMNGETLPPDHGYPARILASGWVATASIKWVGSIEVAEETLHSAYDTVEYIMIGPAYATQDVALGPPITEMPVKSVLDLDWPASMSAGATLIRGRSFAGESKIRSVVYSIDNGPWLDAELGTQNIEGCWRQWQFPWNATPGKHEIRIRATDEQGRTQPDSVPWNHHGYLYNAVVAHPIKVA